MRVILIIITNCIIAFCGYKIGYYVAKRETALLQARSKTIIAVVRYGIACIKKHDIVAANKVMPSDVYPIKKFFFDCNADLDTCFLPKEKWDIIYELCPEIKEETE